MNSTNEEDLERVKGRVFNQLHIWLTGHPAAGASTAQVTTGLIAAFVMSLHFIN